MARDASGAHRRSFRVTVELKYFPRDSTSSDENRNPRVSHLVNMSLTAPIPRFLLPQRGLIWRARLPTPSRTPQAIRHASKKAPKKNPKPLVLEKPTKFNPPSHGSRLPRAAPRYAGPQLSAQEQAAQKTKKYPTMMPPEGSFMHWFLTNRSIHMYIALVRPPPPSPIHPLIINHLAKSPRQSTLFSLAVFVFVTNFKQNSPFADMIPPWTDLFAHPIAFWRRWIDIIRMNTAHVAAETQERRTRKVEDVAKRAQFRKAHGLEGGDGFGGWTAKSDAQLLGPGMPLGDGAAGEPVQEPVREKKKVKMWFGIW
jgi:hypothetical protein